METYTATTIDPGGNTLVPENTSLITFEYPGSDPNCSCPNRTQIVTLTLEELTKLLSNKNKLANEADDAIWILTSTFIIFTMQSGFGLLESGTATAKNEVNIMVKNVIDVVTGGLSFWMFGYAFGFGNATGLSNAFSGWGNFFVYGTREEIGSLYPRFFFQASFATTATTIVSGCMAERVKLEAFIVFSFFNTMVFSFPAHWVWASNGWLSELGMIDIAGAGPVHIIGGVTGLVATIMLKPRYGRYSSKYPPPMASPTNALLGMFMLWWGWLGFNCGSTFGISGHKWKLATRSAVSTLSASVGGGFVGLLLSYIFKERKFDVPFLINSVLGALVGITAGCALAAPWEGLVIGAVGAALAVATGELVDKLHIDDPVGVVGVHAVGGMWSLLAVGLFTHKDDLKLELGMEEGCIGLFYGGGWKLLGIQTAGMVSLITWTVVTSFIQLKLIDLTIGLRMPLQQELLGADLVDHAIGDIHYDKRTQSVISMRRMNASAGAMEEQLHQDEEKSFNGARNRRRLTKQIAARQRALGCVCENMEDGECTCVAQDNIEIKPKNHATSNGAVAEASSSSSRMDDQDARTMWKYAIGRTLNQAEQKRRLTARTAIMGVFKHQHRHVTQTKTTQGVVEDAPSGRPKAGLMRKLRHMSRRRKSKPPKRAQNGIDNTAMDMPTIADRSGAWISKEESELNHKHRGERRESYTGLCQDNHVREIGRCTTRATQEDIIIASKSVYL